MQGYLSELALMKKLRVLPGVTSVSKIPDKSETKGDLLVCFEGKNLTIEVKSVETRSVKYDSITDSWEGKVGCKNSDSRVLIIDGEEFKSSHVEIGKFDVLAISTYSAVGTWDFVFIENRYLPRLSSDKPNLVKTNFHLNPTSSPFVEADILKVMRSVTTCGKIEDIQ